MFYFFIIFDNFLKDCTHLIIKNSNHKLYYQDNLTLMSTKYSNNNKCNLITTRLICLFYVQKYQKKKIHFNFSKSLKLFIIVFFFTKTFLLFNIFLKSIIKSIIK